MMDRICVTLFGDPQGKGRARAFRHETPAGRGYKKASDAELLKAYSDCGSVKAAGERLGMCGQAVHERLKKLGANKPANKWSSEDDAQLIVEYVKYADLGKLSDLAARLGRTKPFIARQAGRLGLTNPRRAKPYLASQISARMKKRLAHNPHPRGALGMKHSDKAKALIGENSRKHWATWKTFGTGQMTEESLQLNSDRAIARIKLRPGTSTYSRSKRGYRPDIGEMFFRSSWEANYARYLNLLVKMKVVESWKFEPETFWFENIKRGVRSYLPDFLVQYRNEAAPVYVEVKGWMDSKSKTKIKRFRKYYPQHKLEVVEKKEYAAIARKWSSAIAGWE